MDAFKWMMLSGAFVVVGLPVLTFAVSLIVYFRRKEHGFLVLAAVLGYYVVNSVLLVFFGINLTQTIYEMRSHGKVASFFSTLLPHFPSILFLVGWSLLAIKKKKA